MASFFKATLVLLAVTILGRLIGFLRNVFITNEFGLGMETDAYFMAFTIPLTMFLVIPGAINAVLIPIFKGMMGEENQARRNELFQKVTSTIFLLFLFLTAAGMLWAEGMVSLLARDFDPEKQLYTAELLRIMMPSLLFIGLVSVFSSVLNAHHEFFSPAMGTVISGVFVILSLYTLAPFIGMTGVAWGTTIGFIVFAFYLVIPLKKRGYHLSWNLQLLKDEHMRIMGDRFLPILAGMVISQLYVFIERFLVSGLGDKKLSSLVLANSIVQLPIAIFSGALVVPLFPLLAEYVKKNQLDQMKSIMEKGFLYQYHVLLPTTIGLVLLSEEIVRFFYAHKATFTQQDVELTAWATIFYGIGILGWMGRDLFTRVFYALENTKIPVVVAGISIVFYIGMSWLLIPPLNHGGIALAFSLASFFNLLLQGWLLRRKIGKLFPSSFFLSIGKGMASGGLMLLGIWALRSPTAGLGILQVPILILVAAVVYFGMLVVLKEETVKELFEKFKSRLNIRSTRSSDK
ncbi:murein biosynthesis integral membrane protein MurJ [Ammoniphilus sp. YIM 78166]|uniref:murein biosynthesis integral membrane protein MurJ n=1 Tax=Ammoniphilus sp. YIM 78166 TaxID=1644106 RepID=UPI001431C37F|nr:murein biosynthesis integral membrane protein MurJ [Ammoniphilus sp. YIM 78166]